MADQERDVSLQHAGSELRGTACVPRPGRLPTVLLLHGSGPMDRDENMQGQRLDVFNTIAAHLAATGIASLRYDKRGCGASTGDFHRTGFVDLVADAKAWIEWLESADFVDPSRIVLLGHSEGCLIAAQLCVQRPSIAGAILLCPFVEDMVSVLLRQAAQIESEIAAARGFSGWLQRAAVRLVGKPTETQRRLIEEVRASTTDTIRFKRQTVGAKWLRELIAIDAPNVFRAVSCPLLAIGGAKDLQCLPSDVARIAELAPGPVEGHVIADMTHILRRDERPPTLLGASALLQKPIDPEVLELVGAWMARRIAASGGRTAPPMDEDEDVPIGVDFRDRATALAWIEETRIKKPFRPSFFAAFHSALSSRSNLRILELGSGPGQLAREILLHCDVRSYVALDWSQAMHDIATEYLGELASRVTFIVRDFREPSWHADLGEFDAIVTMQAAHETRHKRHVLPLLERARTLLGPGGLLLYCDGYLHPATTLPALFFARDEQPRILERAGFVDVQLLHDEGNQALYRGTNYP